MARGSGPRVAALVAFGLAIGLFFASSSLTGGGSDGAGRAPGSLGANTAKRGREGGDGGAVLADGPGASGASRRAPPTSRKSKLSELVKIQEQLSEELANLKALAGKGGKQDDDAGADDDVKEESPPGSNKEGDDDGEGPGDGDGEIKLPDPPPGALDELDDKADDDDDNNKGGQAGAVPPVAAGSDGGDGQDLTMYSITMDCVAFNPDGSLQLTTCRGSPNQRMRMEDGRITAAGRCLAAPASGMRPSMTACKDGDLQRWELQPDPSRPGWGLLRHVGSKQQRCISFAQWRSGRQLVTLAPCSVDMKCVQLTTFVPHNKPAPSLGLPNLVEYNKPAKVAHGQRVLCWVLTMPDSIEKRATPVAQTWAQWCDITLYFSSEPYTGSAFPEDSVVPIKLKNGESRKAVWEKTRKAWRHLYENYREKADWFVKADDDTFVMVGNLRKFLKKHKYNHPHFFGRQFVLSRGNERETVYNSGGAGYVLSREALRLVGGHATALHEDNTQPEDVEMARRLRRVGILTEDTRDESGLELFTPIGLYALRHKEYSREKSPSFWFWSLSYNSPVEGEDCCSKNWVTSHYINPHRMKQIYHATLWQCEANGVDDHI